ncbi:glycoside hydrolase family 28 protein [Pedobacter immunditicola]|uniref:glycoside hydrolase family 28 protein n=1 Tax=Pedobacter immunditicola TaxID=3133440 RepID=UPI0030B27EF0
MNKFQLMLCSLMLSVVYGSYAQTQNNKYSFEHLPVIKETHFKKDTLSIVDFGAKNDGITLNTKSINEAILACSKKGGGVVLIPQGVWKSGPIVLQDNVNLHLQKNALLQFTSDLSQYKLVKSNWEGLPQMRNQSPISATGAVNIAITGYGIIDGAGDAWRMVKKEKLTESQWKKLVASGGALDANKKIWYPSEKSLKGSTLKNPGVIIEGKSLQSYEEVKDFLRPNLLLLTSCKQILLEGVTFQNSPAWNLHPLMCEDLTVRNIYVKNPWYAQNGDGIDIESCKNVLVEGSTFDVGDDGICIKSGRDAAGRSRAMPTENVIIRNSTVYHAHGGFVIGSEMSGGAKNIFISDCTFIGTDIGLRFKTTRGRGGVVEGIHARNIYMKDIAGEAILFDMYYAAIDPIPLTGEKRDLPTVKLWPVTEETPVFRDFHISNVVVDGASKALFIRGLPEMSIRDIYLNQLTMKAASGVDLQEAENIQINNMNLVVDQASPLVTITNGRSINFDQLKYNKAEVLFNIVGPNSSKINARGIEGPTANTKAAFEHGAKEKSLTVK